MANTLTSLLFHIVFSTKNREPWIKTDVEQRLWAYLGGIARQNDLQPLMIGGMDDHVHLLLGLPPTISVSEAVKQIKGGSSRWVKENLPGFRGFGWQDGYGAFTVSKSHIPDITGYIRDQREHHRKRTFQQEYQVLLERHQIQFDPRYLWD